MTRAFRDLCIRLWFSKAMTASPIKDLREAVRWRHKPVQFDVCPTCSALVAHGGDLSAHADWHRRQPRRPLTA